MKSDHGDTVRTVQLEICRRVVNDRNSHNRTAGRDNVCILWAALG
jgi:hypothetical protein